ncbi:MAG: ribosome small subunit-dependent GTPase A [Firmicutes bacterium]|nr:ribosome small subunit-dependent GTPase A [Bacillota bacterium]
MENNKLYRVISTMSHRFLVDLGDEVLVCSARSSNKTQANHSDVHNKFSKKGGTILAGDFVRVDIINKVILSVEDRKNKLIRPAVSNIDQLIMVISSIPQPDFKMLDKMIINAISKKIVPIICINKSDINSDDFQVQITMQYKDIKIIQISAEKSDIDSLKKLLKNKLSVLSGQSAVGKSTIINALTNYETRKIGDLSKAIQRGKNTTTNTELFKINGGLLADTPGFSLTELFDITHGDLDLYYPEFEKHRHLCKYHRCNHINEPSCKIIENKTKYLNRYDRYIEIFNELKEKHDNKYK